VRVLLPRFSDGFGEKFGSSASQARSNTSYGGRTMIPSQHLSIYSDEKSLLTPSARSAIKKRNPQFMHYGSVPWLGTPRLWCRVVCKNYRTKEMILLGLCYGCFRIFQRMNWKTGLSQRGQSGQQGTVSFLKLIKRVLSTSEEKFSFYFESTIKQRLPTVLYKAVFCVS
jgi:hypothetical protein